MLGIWQKNDLLKKDGFILVAYPLVPIEGYQLIL